MNAPPFVELEGLSRVAAMFHFVQMRVHISEVAQTWDILRCLRSFSGH
jgi:hypothetical protein